MDKLDISDIAPEVIQKVRLAVKDSYPLAVSENAVRMSVTIRPERIRRVLSWLVMLDNVERIETTSGTFWRWRDRNGN